MNLKKNKHSDEYFISLSGPIEIKSLKHNIKKKDYNSVECDDSLLSANQIISRWSEDRYNL